MDARYPLAVTMSAWILVVAFALLLTERMRNDLVAVLIVVALALALTGVLKPSAPS